MLRGMLAEGREIIPYRLDVELEHFLHVGGGGGDRQKEAPVGGNASNGQGPHGWAGQDASPRRGPLSGQNSICLLGGNACMSGKNLLSLILDTLF